ncbi:transposase [Mesobacillus maritimus]|uniref:transposase n=1 Tax=Mesobacillus maritimus TaxID=1643336 RepID=UPI00384AD525
MSNPKSFGVKFRYDVLKNDIDCELKDILYSTATRYEYEIKEMEIMPDRIHLFKSTKPAVSLEMLLVLIKAFQLSCLKDFRT